MANIRLFKTAAAAILDFQVFEILTVGTVKRVELRHHAKCRRNRSNHARDMGIFRFFHLGFVMHVFGPPTKDVLAVFIAVQSLVVIDAVVSIMCKF